MSLILSLLFFIFSSFVSAKSYSPIKLVDLPLDNPQETISYWAERSERCQFKTKGPIKLKIGQGPLKNEDELDLLEKIYFSLKEVKINAHHISFKIGAASNVEFIFNYKNCQLEKIFKIDDQLYPFDQLHIEYFTTLGAPVLDKLTLSHPKVTKKIYPNSLDGHLPLYELKLGPAVNIRNNLRPGNRKRFLKGQPIVQPIPAFMFRYGNIFINKDGAGGALFAYEGFALIAAAIYDGEPFRHPDFKTRRNGVFLGPMAQWKGFRVKYMRDWVDHKRGQELKISYRYQFRPTLNLQIIPRIYAQIWDKQYSDYYFGVTPEESAISGFSPYRGERAINISPMCRVLYFQNDLIYLADFGVKFLSPKVYQSPIITDKEEWRMTLGVLYRFF